MDNEKMSKLFAEYKSSGDVSIRNEIAEQYIYIAEILAKKFVGRGVEYDDLYQVACLALIKGVERFDPDMGMQFTTFITPTITGEIKNYFRDKSRGMKIPRKLSALSVEVRKKRDELNTLTGKTPTTLEIATALGVAEEQVLEALEVGSVLSLDNMTESDDEGNDRSLYDVMPDKSNPFEEFEDKETLKKAIASLSASEQEVLELRYVKNLSQTDCAKKMGVSQMFVSRLERKVLFKLRKILEEE